MEATILGYIGQYRVYRVNGKENGNYCLAAAFSSVIFQKLRPRLHSLEVFQVGWDASG